MKTRAYQQDFSEGNEAMHDASRREQKARTMIAVLRDYADVPLDTLQVLDVGSSTGIIDHSLSRAFGSVTGIDIDARAVDSARSSYVRDNLRFSVGDAMSIEAPDESFDVVICSQVYEHVPDAFRMMGEIERVLRPDGVCYFAASNRLMWNEPHYNLPLLSVMPRGLAHLYVRMTGKGRHYHELHYTVWGLKRLVQNFQVIDYTRAIVQDPVRFGAQDMLPPGSPKQRIASVVAQTVYWLMPGYIWLLKKPAS